MADPAPTADAPLGEWLSEHHAPAPLMTALPGATFSNPPQWFSDFLSGNAAGERGPIVNEHTALNYAALYSCVSLIAGTIASLPLKVYRRRADGGQDEATDRPEWDRLQVEFNPNTSAMSGRETGLGHLLTWGNSYTQVVRNRLPSRDVIRLQPLGPDVCGPDVNGRGDLVYKIYDRESGQEVDELQRDEVLHVPGLSFDAMCGYSVVRAAKTILRAGMAQDREAERFVTRGIRPPGAVQFPAGKKFADEKQALRFRDSFRRVHSTEEGSLNVLILEDGAEWQSIGIDPVSAQLLESRKFSAQEIAGIYHVPPHMMGLVDKVSSWGTGIEEMTIGFVVYTLLPILRRIEQEYNRKLFLTDKALYCEHVLSGLLRGDHLKRAEALQIMMNSGVVTVNEWRRLEGMNPAKGGNVRYYPLNMGRIDEDGNDIPAPPAADPGAPKTSKSNHAPIEDRPSADEPTEPSSSPAGNNPGATRGARIPARNPARLASHLRHAIVGASARCLRKEAAEAVRAARKPEAFVQWLAAFYPKHFSMVEETLRPLLESWHAAFADPTPEQTLGKMSSDRVHAHLDRSREDLLAAAECKPDELAESVERVTERWVSERLAEIGAEFSYVDEVRS